MAGQRKRRFLFPLGALVTVGLMLALACGGGGQAQQATPAPQQPEPAAQPVPAAPAPEPAAVIAPVVVKAPAAVPGAPGGAPKGAVEPKYGGILIHGNRSDPPAAWDTMRTPTINLHQPGGALNGNGNLVRPCRGNAYEVCGGVATGWEYNTDFTEWTFRIREGIKWHDGTPFTAEDAKFWVELAAFGGKSADGKKTRGPANFKAAFGDLRKVEVLEGNRLRLTLGRSGGPDYLFDMATAYYSIAHPRHLMKPLIEQGQLDVAPQDIGWVSLGPFKMKKYDKGTRIQLVRNDLYWEKDEKGRQLPFLDGIDYAIFTDPAALDAAFRVGRLDAGTRGAGFTLTKERQSGYIRDLGDKVWFAEIPATRGGLSFDIIRAGPWQDVRVRKAIALWMDKRAAIPSVLGGFGYLFTVLGPQNPYTSPEFITWPGWNDKTRERDRAEAKRLMAEAGYPEGGFGMTHLCRRLWIARCEFIHSQLNSLGIELKIKLVDDAGWQAGSLSLDFDTHQGTGVASAAVVPGATEPALTTYDLSRAAEAKHRDQKIPELFTRIRAASSYDQRVQTWREVERYVLLERVYAIPLFGDMSVIPFRSYVKEVAIPQENNPNDTDYVTVWLDK